jgi:hypothetical protein
MHGCNDFRDLAALQSAMNDWFQHMLWRQNWPSPRESWFQEVRDTLERAFGSFCATRLPVAPPVPPRVGGPDEIRTLLEVRAIAKTMGSWATAVHAYMHCIYATASPACRRRTVSLAGRFETWTHSVILAQPLYRPNAERQLCINFAQWARAFRRWSMAFADFENALAKCISGELPQLLVPLDGPNGPTGTDDVVPLESMEGDVVLEILQVSPVPWPPWPRIDDEV